MASRSSSTSSASVVPSVLLTWFGSSSPRARWARISPPAGAWHGRTPDGGAGSASSGVSRDTPPEAGTRSPPRFQASPAAPWRSPGNPPSLPAWQSAVRSAAGSREQPVEHVVAVTGFIQIERNTGAFQAERDNCQRPAYQHKAEAAQRP